MKKRLLLSMLLIVMLIFTGCRSSSQTDTEDSSDSSESSGSTATAQSVSSVDTSDMFTDRDMEIGYDEETSAMITLSDSSASCSSDAVQISGSTITITEEGTYVLSGTLDDGMIVVNAEDSDKIQLVLNGVEITSKTSAAIYIKEADKVFITTASGTENTLINSGTYTDIDDNKIDSVIFSKSDLTLNGSGTLTIQAEAGHGIVSKDDLVLTSGTYQITAASHGLSGKDSVRIANGTYTITSGKDGIHAENSDDTSLGFVYIANGTYTIASGDDGMHADSALKISDGTINITESYEGLEGLTIDIDGGTIDLVASDDGLNAAGGNDSSGNEGRRDDIFATTDGAYIKITGGKLHVNASGDGIDSNNDLIVTGGETYVSGPTNGGNGALDYAGEATISGGIFVAAGSTGMEQNFDSSSTQGVMMITTSGSAGSTISLSDSDGTELVSWEADKEYGSVIVSCPEIIEGESYTLSTGGTSTEVTMDSLVYSESNSSDGNSGGHGDIGGSHGKR